jgi:hypothetical protein
MALLHEAELRPTKLELLQAWLPTRSWYPGPVGQELTRVSACRFDDPAGEVGVETMLVRAGDGPVLHTPLTYRGAPLQGGDEWLVGAMEHSVLGPRWVYDACGDPVYAAVLAQAILTGGGEAEEYVDAGGQVSRREPVMTVRGSGSDATAPSPDGPLQVVDGDPTVVRFGSTRLAIVRVLPRDLSHEALRLTGAWPGADPAVLAYARLTD